MKIGIMGGVFDPIHFGHLQAAEIVKEKLELKRVLFIPSGLPPHKPKPIANKKDRFKMLKLSLKNNKQFIPLDLEIKKIGYSYTIDTVIVNTRRDTIFKTKDYISPKVLKSRSSKVKNFQFFM